MNKFTLFLLGILLSSLTRAQESKPVLEVESPLSNRIENALISNDSTTVLAADSAGYIFFWRKENATIAKIIRAHQTVITQIALTADGKYFTATSIDRGISVWEFGTGKKTGELQVETPSALLAPASDGKSLFYTSGKQVSKSQLPELNNPSLIYETAGIITCGANLGENYFVIGFNDSLLLLRATDGKKLFGTQTCTDIRKLAGSGNYLCAWCRDGSFHLFELAENTLNEKKQATYTAYKPEKLLVLPEQQTVLFTTQRAGVHSWNWTSNKFTAISALPGNTTVLGSSENLILTGDALGKVAFWNLTLPRETPQAENQMRPSEPEPVAPTKINDRQVRLQDAIEVSTQVLEVSVWDDENVDGDTISLSLNGEWILENFMVTKEKKKLTLYLAEGKKNTLVLYAENLGKAPPNTAVISFHDGSRERTLTLNSDLKRCDAVDFILKK